MLRATLPRRPEARRILLGTAIASIGRGLTLPFLFIYLHQVRGIGADTVGLLIGWFGLVSLIVAPLGGALVDRFGARRVVLPLFLLDAVGVGALAFVHNVPTAFAVLTVSALGGPALWSAQNTILASLTEPDEQQRTFGLSFTLLNLGIGIGGMVSGLIVDTARPVTFQLLYALDAVTYLVPLGILLSMPAVGRRLVDTLTKERSKVGYAVVLRDRAFLRYVVFGLVLTSCGYAQIEVGFAAFTTVIAGAPARAVGWALAANTLVIVLSQLFVLRWLEGRSRTRALAVAACIMGFSWLVLGAAGFLGQRGFAIAAIAGVIACSAIFAFGETLLSPVMPAITNALATDEVRGRYNALGSMIWGLSAVIGPVTAGPLIGAHRSTLWVIMVTSGCAVAAVLALSLRRRLTPEQDGRFSSGSQLTPEGVDGRPSEPATA
ncbi:MFS transporter [Luedemannella helvata]|uniref:MFS transporter n=1 Tax=Luedemannella helvata TaxID=349315 RepID=A0ABP4W9R5_9ACTN